ncbi:hypothetical protein RhiirA1_471729 [Rhizophagus irregularis]|uniref:RNase H type-1 domain-containing protein n=1 Tax=Rhizophagus irregularis TaxID=588596 RepID=A0A2N0R3P8_9GLOM|nr:hypothetical protein RhiirA1_471729 [Rhizophagus irregularis]
MGMLTALLVSPFNCRVNIYTDSANCITTFNTRMHLGIVSPRQKLKQSNFLLWDLIFFLINQKNLLVTLFKVPGHSNNLYNDEADTLAKAGAHIREPIIINHKFFAHQSLGFASWNRLHVIDRNVRKWADNVIQPLIFNSMINNKALIPIKKQILDGEIDWTFTREWLNYNNSDAPCSINLSKYHGNKIKKCNFIYPTIDIQQRNYPRLYPLGIIPCIQCSNARDMNAHVGLCIDHSNDVVTLLMEAAYDLYDIIIENSTGISFALRETIESSPLFNITFPGALSQTHPGYLLIHHLVPSDLTVIFYNYIKDKKLRFSIFIKFFTTLMQKIDTHIWAKRSSLIKCWERTLSITKTKKRFYRRRYKKQTVPPSADDTINNDVPQRSYTHRRITATPYFREGGFYDNHAHIRWTSSNFLHSAHWTVYRDCLGFNQIDLFSFINNSYIGNVLDIR